MKIHIDGSRVLRTLIQSAAGAGVALLAAVVQDWSLPAIISSLISFGVTVGTAVLMNLQKQMEE